MFNSHKNVLLRLSSSFSIIFKSNLSILFYGSNQFSLPSLQALHSNLILPDHHRSKLIHSIDICTKSAKNEIGNYTIKNKLNLILWPYEVPLNKYDVGIVVSFGDLIPKQSIDACSKGILNAHASLLPKLRGAAPLFRAILNDYEETGVTIMSIKADRFDVGDIIMQEKIKIEEDTKAIDLFNDLSKMSSDLLMKCLSDLDFYLQRSIKQNDEEATKALRIKSGENRIDWSKMDLRHVYKMYRAFDGLISIYTTWTNGCEMKLHEMVKLKRMLQIQNEINEEFNLSHDNLENLRPGAIRFSNRKKIVCIKCKDNNWAGFKAICLKGHPLVSSKQFNNIFLFRELRKSRQIILGD